MAENQKSAPVLRFKDEKGSDYPDWEEKLLRDISRFSKGKGISKTDVKENGTVKCIRYGELYTRYGETISNVLSSTNVPVSELVLSHKNDVIIPASGETALDIASAACITVEGVALGGDINIIRCQQNGIFLAYYLISKKKDIAKLAQGISIVHLYSAQLASLSLRIPSKQEQQKIATFLSSVDTKIEQLRKKKALLEQYKKGMMQRLFSQEIRFKDEQGNEYPGWDKRKLSDFSEINRGKTIVRNDIVNEGYPVIAGGQRSPYCHSSFTHENVITVSASGAFAGYVSYHPHKIWASDCSVVRAKSSSCTLFVYYLLNHLQTRIYVLQSGGAQPHVYPKDLYTLTVTIPVSSKEQQKIANFLSAIDKKIELVAEQLEHARTFKKGLLQQMFI